jgi:hypothetical protein
VVKSTVTSLSSGRRMALMYQPGVFPGRLDLRPTVVNAATTFEMTDTARDYEGIHAERKFWIDGLFR